MSFSNIDNTPVIIESIECINRRSNVEDYGYSIKTTNGGYIHVLIDSMQKCCETFGVYAMKNEKNVKKIMKSFVGKEIVLIEISPLKVQQDVNDEDNDEDDINDDDDQMRWVELHLKDDPHPLKLYLYNNHNGYYTHCCSIEWKGQVVPDENITFEL